MSKLKCEQCGKPFEGRANRKYCSEKCRKEALHKRRAEMRKLKKAAGLKSEESLSRIRCKGPNAALMEDVRRADASHISYGVYKGREAPSNLWENRRGEY